MAQQYTVLSLDEFNHAVSEGSILEVDISGKSQLIRIFCTSLTGLRRGFCFAHMHDLWLVRIHGERMFKIGCGVCGATGYRKLGRQNLINGKYESKIH